MSLSDTRAKLIARLHRRKTREREGLVLVEGPHAVEEALAAGAVPKFAVLSDRFDPGAHPEVLSRMTAALPRGEEDLHRVEDAELTRLADTEAPQGVLLVVEQPEPGGAPGGQDAAPGRGRWLVLDGVQDPGNVGTLIRAAAAFACDGVLTLPGTADPWSTKTVRASAGMVFRLPIVTTSSRDLEGSLDRLPRPILIAEAGGGTPAAVTGISWSLVLGNEGAGVGPEVRAMPHRTVAVPMPGGIESLNVGVAGAILLYALTPAAGAPATPDPSDS